MSLHRNPPINSPSNPIRRVRITLCLVAAVLLAAGCGRPKLPDASDADKEQARAALVAALDAWQAGKLGELKNRTPPITLVDDDVVLGHALVSYELDPLREIAPHRDVAVQLILRGRDGRALHRPATYQVTLTPAPTVLRNDP